MVHKRPFLTSNCKKIQKKAIFAIFYQFFFSTFCPQNDDFGQKIFLFYGFCPKCLLFDQNLTISFFNFLTPNRRCFAKNPKLSHFLPNIATFFHILPHQNFCPAYLTFFLYQITHAVNVRLATLLSTPLRAIKCHDTACRAVASLATFAMSMPA